MLKGLIKINFHWVLLPHEVPILILFLGLELFLALIFVSASGPRGSDQFWYLSDIRAVSIGDARSNSLFPNLLQTYPLYLKERPFIHNTLYPYLVAPLTQLWDPYHAAIVINVITTIATAIIIYHSISISGINNSNVKYWAVIAGAAYLFLPITFWQTCQPTPEVILSFLCSLLSLLVISQIERHVMLFLYILCLLSAYSLRSIYWVGIICSIFLFVLSIFISNSKNYLFDAIYVVIISVLTLLIIRTIGATTPYSILELMQNGAKSGDNMELWLSDGKLEINIKDIVSKVITNLYTFIRPSLVQIFLFPFTLLCITIPMLLARLSVSKKIISLTRPRFLLALNNFVIASTALGIMILFQNQFRYCIFAIPGLIITNFVLFFHYISWPKLINPVLKKLSISTFFGLCIFVDVILAQNLFREGIEASISIDKARRFILNSNQVHSEFTLVNCYKPQESLLLAYSLPEVLFINFDPNAGSDFFQRIVRLSKASRLLCNAHEVTKILPSNIVQNPISETNLFGSDQFIFDISKFRINKSSKP